MADDPDAGLAELGAPVPRAAIANPIVIVLVVVFAIAVVTAGLVVANGDDFAKARVPLRTRLPISTAGASERANVGDSSLASAGAPTRVEVRVAQPLTDPGATASAYQLQTAERRRVQSLGVALGLGRGPVLTGNGVHRLVSGDRALLVQVGGGSSFMVISGLTADCRDPMNLEHCAFGGGGQATDGAATTTTTTVARATSDPASVAKVQGLSGRVQRSFGQLAGSGRVDAAGGPWIAHFPLQVDGLQAAGWEVELTLDPVGDVRSGRGYLGEPDKVGTYPLVGIDEGVARLRAGWGSTAAGVATDLPVAAPKVTSPPDTTEVVCTARPDGGRICEFPPPQSSPPTTIEPVEPVADLGPLTVVGVHLGLQLTQDGRGTFLVPAYVFQTDGQGDVTVPAIAEADSVVAGAEPVIAQVERPGRIGASSPP
jgi:hypothetical protein